MGEAHRADRQGVRQNARQMMKGAALIVQIGDAVMVGVPRGPMARMPSSSADHLLALEHVEGMGGINGTTPATWANTNSPTSHGANRRIVCNLVIQGSFAVCDPVTITSDGALVRCRTATRNNSVAIVARIGSSGGDVSSPSGA